MNDILSEISDAADDLEDGLDDNLFEDIGLEQRKVSSSLLPDIEICVLGLTLKPRLDSLLYVCKHQTVGNEMNTVTGSPRPRLMFEQSLFLSGKKIHWISHSHIQATPVYKPWLVNEYR